MEAEMEMSLRLVEPGLLSLPRARELLMPGRVGGEAAEPKGLWKTAQSCRAGRCRGSCELGQSVQPCFVGSML